MASLRPVFKNQAWDIAPCTVQYRVAKTRCATQLSLGESQWTSAAKDSVATAGNVKGIVLMLYGLLGSI